MNLELHSFRFQDTKSQKDRHLRMMEHVHCLLCGLMALCLHYENIISPRMLDQIARTLHKFYACLRGQNELGKFKRLFKQSEITAQLDVCEGELKDASDIFAKEDIKNF
ncbi:hypothetical protein DFH09DRAFT_1088700 [Mycena vulgaris]|nr:hypothetical protein DFH09DRAFT_1088700 [Mycena vulgaris]